jgi:hypothetical protein
VADTARARTGFESDFHRFADWYVQPNPERSRRLREAARYVAAAPDDLPLLNIDNCVELDMAPAVVDVLVRAEEFPGVEAFIEAMFKAHS